MPWQSSRCVARWEGAEDSRRASRAGGTTAVAAAKQSRRALVPEVTELHHTPQVLERVRDVVGRGGVVAVLHESAQLPLASLPLRGRPPR